MKKITASFLSAVLTLTSGTLFAAPTAPPAALVARPPQYVVVSFDGSKTLGMWQQTLALAERTHAHFTYFISGVYFLADQNKTHYVGPHHSAGRSDIGFGGSIADLNERVDYLNEAQKAGHEIGSHANGHFDGSAWTAQDWLSEFKQFNDLIFNVAQINKLSAAHDVDFQASRVHGFRAPLLAVGPGLDATLRLPEIDMNQHYTYDASRTALPGYWPQKNNGIWNFPLPEVVLAGTAKKTIAMDYNMYFTQTALYYNHPTDNAWVPRPGPVSAAPEMQKQAFDTYMNHFKAQYYGNRAPVIFGNHFSTWNNAVYWNALIQFTQAVCSEPEVQCISAETLQNLLENTNPTLMADYRTGHFDKSNIPVLNYNEPTAAPILADLNMKVDSRNAVSLNMQGAHAAMLARAGQVRWTLDNKALPVNPEGKPVLPADLQAGETHQLSAAVSLNSREVARTTKAVTIVPSEAGTRAVLGEQDLELLPTMVNFPALTLAKNEAGNKFNWCFRV